MGRLSHLPRVVSLTGASRQDLLVLRLEHDLLKLAADDEMGRSIQDGQLVVKKK